MINISYFFKKFFAPHLLFSTRTFTYYVSGPPQRSSGYREKEFDRVMQEFLRHGFQVLSVNTQSHSSSAQSGMWILLTVRPTNQKAAVLALDFPSTFDDNLSLDIVNTLEEASGGKYE